MPSYQALAEPAAAAPAFEPTETRLDVLGVPISAVNMPMVTSRFANWIAERSRHYVCVRDVHGVVRCQDDPQLMRIHRNASLNTPDGMPLVWLLRAHGFAIADRVYGPDLVWATCNAAELSQARHYFYGGRNGSTVRMIETLRQMFPEIVIAGHYEPPMRPSGAREQAGVIDEINEARPDIIWVGLGTPKQEYWMADHRAAFEAPIVIGVGAAFDFYAGTAAQAPRWVQRSGFEWLFRVWVDPKRLGRRYARVVPRFIGMVARDYAKRAFAR